jgi:hypothetical protein
MQGPRWPCICNPEGNGKWKILYHTGQYESYLGDIHRLFVIANSSPKRMASHLAALPLENLSRAITENASIVSQYLQANRLPQPSREADGPATLIPSGSPQNVHQARQRLVAASLELFQLAIGPSEFLPHLATGVR